MDHALFESHPSSGFRYRAFLAVGSNLGDRFGEVSDGLALLCDDTFERSCYAHSKLTRTSHLYHTAPMYVTDQPAFLNGAVEVYTNLAPSLLLKRVKLVEKRLGRNFGEITNGPRPVDLDILFVDELESQDRKDDGDSNSASGDPIPLVVDTPGLTVPHPRMQEREFVLAPLLDVAGSDYLHPILNCTVGTLWEGLAKQEEATLTPDTAGEAAVRVLPLPRGRMVYFNETVVMGVLNVTPDSFSDGGKWNTSIDAAVAHALEMEVAGAKIIDVGGESTRPGAEEVLEEEELERIIPVIKKIRQTSDVAISVDTRHANVAQAAVLAGADIVNDVSGGTFDASMLDVVANLRVPMILMHMRGTPESMQGLTEYGDLVGDVVESLQERSSNAERAGVPRWLQVVDPGIGFAKDLNGNLGLLKNMGTIRSKLGDLPVLLGTSRKGFIGELTGETRRDQRDYGTVASFVAAMCLGNGPIGCDIVRVHNVEAARQAVKVVDAIRNAR